MVADYLSNHYKTKQNPAPGALHQRLARRAIRWLTERGWTVTRAEVMGYPFPSYVHHPYEEARSRPDIIAWRKGVIAIGEVETSTSVRSRHSRSQIRIFSEAARSMGGGFLLVVPESAEHAATVTIKEETTNSVTLLLLH